MQSFPLFFWIFDLAGPMQYVRSVKMELSQVVSNCIGTAVTQVFSTMLALKTVHNPDSDDFNPPPFTLDGVCGNVSFAGRFTGAVYFNLSEKLTNKITGRIIGEGIEYKDHEENDVIGELTNMITGNLKTMMADKGYNCQLSIPNLMRGDGIRVSGKGFAIWVAKTFEVPELTEKFIVRTLAKIDV